MSQSYEFKEKGAAEHVDDIQFDKQGNIIYNEFEQKQRNSERWQDLEKRYGINFGDVVKIDNKIDNHLGRLQELHVSEFRDHKGVTIDDRVYIKLLGDPEFKDFECEEISMTAKEWLKDIKVQPQEKEKKLSITEKIKNTIKTKVQTFKKGGAAERLANKRALHNTQGLER